MSPHGPAAAEAPAPVLGLEKADEVCVILGSPANGHAVLSATRTHNVRRRSPSLEELVHVKNRGTKPRWHAQA